MSLVNRLQWKCHQNINFSLKKIQSNVASQTLWSFISAIKLKSLTLFRPQYASLWPTVRSYKELPLKCGMLNCACSTVVVHGTERVDTHSALQGGVLLLPSDAVASLLANGSAAFSLRPANERWRYFVTPSLIGWAQTESCTFSLCPAKERRRYFVTTSLIGWVQAESCTAIG